MKVYIVRRGWDDTDSSPQIKEIFSTRQAAVAFIEKDLEEDLEFQRHSMEWGVRQRDAGPKKWSLEILIKDWKDWIQDEVWLLEEHEVHE